MLWITLVTTCLTIGDASDLFSCLNYWRVASSGDAAKWPMARRLQAWNVRAAGWPRTSIQPPLERLQIRFAYFSPRLRRAPPAAPGSGGAPHPAAAGRTERERMRLAA